MHACFIVLQLRSDSCEIHGYVMCYVMQNYFSTFYFGEFKPHNSNTRVMSIEVATVSIFTPFNFAVSLSSRNKGHANIKEFTVTIL